MVSALINSIGFYLRSGFIYKNNLNTPRGSTGFFASDFDIRICFFWLVILCRIMLICHIVKFKIKINIIYVAILLGNRERLVTIN